MKKLLKDTRYFANMCNGCDTVEGSSRHPLRPLADYIDDPEDPLYGLFALREDRDVLGYFTAFNLKDAKKQFYYNMNVLEDMFDDVSHLNVIEIAGNEDKFQGSDLEMPVHGSLLALLDSFE